MSSNSNSNVSAPVGLAAPLGSAPASGPVPGPASGGAPETVPQSILSGFKPKRSVIVILLVVMAFAVVALVINSIGLSYIVSVPSTVIVDGQTIVTNQDSSLGISQVVSIVLTILLIIFCWYYLLYQGYGVAKKALENRKCLDEKPKGFKFDSGHQFDVIEPLPNQNVCDVPKPVFNLNV
jgi:hypothetical protein